MAYTRGMARHASWFQLIALVLVVIGLVTLATPAPARAMDPRLILAIASAAGALALIGGYLIVASGREKQRAASLEEAYACGEREASGPMGCGGPVGLEPVAVPSAVGGPMVAEGRGAQPAGPIQSGAQACPGFRSAGPMGCDGPEASAPSHTSPASTTFEPLGAAQGQ
jgi:hypothetical protein